MATIEERLQALEREHERLQVLEQEHTQLKKTIELQTIAIRALVSKEAFEKLQDTVEKIQEQNGKTFDALIVHDRLTNERLGDIQTQLIEQDNKIVELDGKVVGLQTEMRQRFNGQDSKIAGLERRFDQTDIRLDRLETLLTRILDRLP